MWAHDGHVRILPTSLYWPMIATCIFSRRARIGLIQPIMYLTIYTSGPIGGSLCYCQLTCNGPQQVATAGNICLVLAHDGRLYILPMSSHWPNSTYYVSDNIHVWAHRRELVLLPINL